MHKILVGHRVTSPMLLGIKDGGNGLASNSDEIMVASQLFNSTVIRNFQDEILDALEEVLELNGEVPELYFITSQPIEFTEDDQEETEEGYEVEDKKVAKVEDKDKEDNKVDQNLSSAIEVAMSAYLKTRD